MNKLNNAFDELQNAINDCQSDMSKFVEGNNSAGTRIRKAMQSVKTMAQGIRVEVQEQKNAAFPLPLIAASVRTLVVSWKDAADINDSV